MNKQKAKNITLGVSIALNILGSLLIGGSLIHACNASTSDVNAVSSPSEASHDKFTEELPRLLPMEASTIPSGTYVFNEIIDVEAFPASTQYLSFVYEEDYYFGIASGTGGGGDLVMPKNKPYDTHLYFINMLEREVGVYDPFSGGWIGSREIVIEEDQSVSLDFSEWFFENVENDTPTASSSSDPEPSGSRIDVIGVPVDFWGYRLLNGSYDSNTGGLITTAEITTIFSGGVRIGGIPFTLGDSANVYDAVEFYYWNFYGRDFVNEKGEIVRASSDGFKNVFYLDHISVLPQGLDPATGSNWIVIGSAVYGMDDSGSLYVNAHRFNWLDQAYKVIKVEQVSDPFEDNYLLTGLLTSAMVNPTLKNMSRSEAFRLAFTGTSGNANGVVLGGAGMADVFSLLGEAFSSWSSIFGVYLLPNLTIGTILFLPLIVIVILAIIRLLNK